MHPLLTQPACQHWVGCTFRWITDTLACSLYCWLCVHQDKAAKASPRSPELYHFSIAIPLPQPCTADWVHVTPRSQHDNHHHQHCMLYPQMAQRDAHLRVQAVPEVQRVLGRLSSKPVRQRLLHITHAAFFIDDASYMIRKSCLREQSSPICTGMRCIPGQCPSPRGLQQLAPRHEDEQPVRHAFAVARAQMGLGAR